MDSFNISLHRLMLDDMIGLDIPNIMVGTTFVTLSHISGMRQVFHHVVVFYKADIGNVRFKNLKIPHLLTVAQ